jgi:hypothetical protein
MSVSNVARKNGRNESSIRAIKIWETNSSSRGTECSNNC